MPRDVFLSGGTFAQSFDIANLVDEQWYSTNINSTGQFDASFALQGYYPLVKSTDGSILPNQKLNPLPSILIGSKPEFLDYVVDEETNDYVDVTLKFTNEAESTITDIKVNDVTASIMQQEFVDDIYHVKVRLNNPTKYVTGYEFTSFTYRTLKDIVEVQINPTVTLDVSFYRLISSLDEWGKYLGAKSNSSDYAVYMKSNYRLGATLDFSSVSAKDFYDKYRVNGTFYGKLDGDGYSIQNINLNDLTNGVRSVLFDNLTGAKVENINFRDITWNKIDTQLDQVGIFYLIYDSEFDHVNLYNIDFKAKYRVGGLSAYAIRSNFSNITANNVKLRKIDSNNHLYMGGILAYVDYVSLTNSYIKNVDIQTDSVNLAYNVGLGGLVGYSGGYSRIENVYAIGKIITTSYAGGIAGNGAYAIQQAYSDVYLETDGDFNAGIAGSNSTTASVKNSFSVGNFIYSVSDPLHTNRIISSENYWYLNNNYGYKYQTFNNQTKDEMDAKAVLTYEELCDPKTYTDRILFTNNFDYSEVGSGILPKLKDTSGNLLPNQTNNYLTSNEISVEIRDSYIDSDEKYHVEFNLTHQGYEVDKFTIDGMNITNEENINISQYVDNYKITSYKSEAYDKYNLKISMHKADDPSQTKEYVVSIEYPQPAYWKITSAQEWQDVMPKHGYGSENIMISGTIDFTGMKDVYTNVTANRIIGDPNNTNKIIGYSDNLSRNEAHLISTVYSELDNISFENINLAYEDAAYNYVGIVGIVQGTVRNVGFKNCSISGGNNDTGLKSFVNSGYSLKAGMIGYVSGTLENITIDNIDISIENKAAYTSSAVGGLVGYMTYAANNIDASNIRINVENGANIGGVVGMAERKTTEAVSMDNMHITSTDSSRRSINGTWRVGGLVGYSNNIALINSSASNIDVTCLGSSLYSEAGYVGGLIGSVGINMYNLSADKVNVKANNSSDASLPFIYGRAGAIAGYSGNLTDVTVTNSTVEANFAAGGITGQNSGTITTSSVTNTKVTANKGAGGLYGVGYHSSYSSVSDSTIKALVESAGGIVGSGTTYDINGVATTKLSPNVSVSRVSNTSIETPRYGGGIIGYATTNNSNISRSYVVNGTSIKVTGEGYAGGLIGRASGYGAYINYVDNTVTISNTGQYTGGIAGYMEWIDTNYASNFYQNISTGTIKGKDYTGGVIGYFDTNVTNSSYLVNHYSNIDMAKITQTEGNNIFSYGYVSERGLKGSKYLYHLATWEKATINGNSINNEKFSNLTGNSSFEILENSVLANRTRMVSSVNETNYGFNTTYYNDFKNTSVILENFAISFHGMENEKTYLFKLEGVNLTAGDYKLAITGINGGNALATFDVNVDSNGNVSDVNNSDGYIRYTVTSLPTVQNLLFTIYKEDNGTKTDLCSAEIRNVRHARTVMNTSVTKQDGEFESISNNYVVAKTSDSNGNLLPNGNIQITVNNTSGQNLKWYRLSMNNGYDISNREILPADNTSVISEDRNTLTTNVSAVYYAISEDNNYVSQLVRYDGTVSYPVITDSTYSVLDGQKYIPYAKAFKKSSLTPTEPEVVVIPEFDVYASGVDTFNIEFDRSIEFGVNSSPLFNVSILITGSQKYEYPLTQRVMSLGYDYASGSEISITVSEINNPSNSKTVTYKQSDIAQTISLTNDAYYYINKDQGITTNGNKVEGTYVHIYGNKAIQLVDGQFKKVDIGNESSIANTRANGELLASPVPLKHDTVDGFDYDYYRDFMVNTSTNEVIYQMLFNTNGDAEPFGFEWGATKHKGTGLVLDKVVEYDEGSGDIEPEVTTPSVDTDDIKEEEKDEATTVETVNQTRDVGEKHDVIIYLNTNNTLFIQVENDKQIPKDFVNNGIQELAFNVNTSANTYVMVKYTDSVVIFDYSKGEFILNEKTSDKSLSSFSLSNIAYYASEYFSNIMSFFEGEPPVTDTMNYKYVINELNLIPDSEMRDIYSLTLDGNDQINMGENNVAEGEGYNEEGIILDQEGILDEFSEGQSMTDAFDDSTNISALPDQLPSEDLTQESETSNTTDSSNESSQSSTVVKVSRDYIPVYNAEKANYEIYTKESIVQGKATVSENEKVQQAVDNGYQLSNPNSMFNKQSKKATSDYVPQRVILYVGIFVSVVGLLIFLRLRIKKIRN